MEFLCPTYASSNIVRSTVCTICTPQLECIGVKKSSLFCQRGLQFQTKSLPMVAQIFLCNIYGDKNRNSSFARTCVRTLFPKDTSEHISQHVHNPLILLPLFFFSPPLDKTYYSSPKEGGGGGGGGTRAAYNSIRHGKQTYFFFPLIPQTNPLLSLSLRSSGKKQEGKGWAKEEPLFLRVRGGSKDMGKH